MASDLRVIVSDADGEQDIIEQILPLVEWMAQRAEAWLPSHRFEIGNQREFGMNPLYEDEILSICAVTWPPGGYVALHRHNGWEILAPIFGCARHSIWKRTEGASPPEHAGAERVSEITLRSGEAAVIMPGENHGLETVGPTPCLTLHVYGRDPSEPALNHSWT